MTDLPEQVARLISMAIEEDLGSGDLTSEALMPEDGHARAVIEARQSLVCSGLDIAREVFERIHPGMIFHSLKEEGEGAAAGDPLAEILGPVRALMAGERTALNFLQRTCGVATLSRQYAAAAGGRAVILDSRKTIPGWRWLDKMAVRAGGCSNHRMGLYDGVLIKDNHIVACGGVAEAVRRARENAPAGVAIEVEVEDIREMEEALSSGADTIMLDNFSPEEVAEAVTCNRGRARIEVSGGIDLENIEQYLAAADIDFISVGALTHSAPAVDIAMEITAAKP